MHDTPSAAPDPSRRSLLKAGLLGTAFLATAGFTATLSGCSASTPASGFAVLRSSDLPLLKALIPAVLEGAVAPDQLPQAIDSTLHNIDHVLHHLSPEMLKLTVQLFDVLALPLTRGPLTGVWGSWDNAPASAVRSFLDRWQNSAIGLLKMGHASLLQLVLMGWYGYPQSWAHCGYPGPPTV